MQVCGSTTTVSSSNLRVPPGCFIWDLPGVGTPNFPQATYVKDMGIRHFDLVVLMTASRFTEAEKMLMDELRLFDVPYFAARNKIEDAVQCQIDEELEDDPDMSSERRTEISEATLTGIRSHLTKECGLQRPYLMSLKPQFRTQFDFQALCQDLAASICVRRVSDLRETECPVCLESFRLGVVENVAQCIGIKEQAPSTRLPFPPCGHGFCRKCFPLLSVCPICRLPKEDTTARDDDGKDTTSARAELGDAPPASGQHT